MRKHIIKQSQLMHLSNKTILFIILFGSALVWIPILLTITGPKDVANAGQVWDAIEAAGYQPVDATELYINDIPNLTQCIAFERDDEYFNFYFLKEQIDASSLYGYIGSYINTHFYGSPYAEHTSAQSNYCIRTYTASGRYSVDIYVGNTAVFAYCDDGNGKGIGDVLRAIGYFD